MPDGDRRIPRVQKVLRVMFDDGRGERSGHTVDLSKRGMKVQSAHVLMPGTRLGGRIILPGEKPAAFRAEVVWARRLRGVRTTAEQNAMGLRFLEPPDPPYDDFLLRVAHNDTPLSRSPSASWSDPPTLPLLIPGLEGRTMAVVSSSDLACRPELHPASLSMPRATALMEEAVGRALAPHLHGCITLGVTWEVTVLHSPPTPPGTPLVAVATLLEVSGSTGSRLRFHACVREGIREIASGFHIRVVVQPRA